MLMATMMPRESDGHEAKHSAFVRYITLVLRLVPVNAALVRVPDNKNFVRKERIPPPIFQKFPLQIMKLRRSIFTPSGLVPFGGN